MKSYPMASSGLKLVFWGEIIGVIAVFLALVPVLGVLLSIAGTVLVAVGLFKAASDDDGYRTAFYLDIAVIVLSIISAFTTSGGVLNTLLDIAEIIVSLAAVYYVTTTTGNLLHSLGQDAQAGKGHTVWRIYLVCAVVSVVVTVLSLIPILAVLSLLVSVVYGIAQLVGYILYLIYLNKSYQLL